MNIAIQQAQLPALEYQGQRVVTLPMIDEAHERPEGTARNAFHRNFRHFIAGEDFVKVTPDEYRGLTSGMHSAYYECASVKRTRKNSPDKITEDVTLFFESGYLVVVKSFRDDLSWQVQRELVRAYFRRPEAVTFHHVDLPSLEELAAMPISDARNIVTLADRDSKQFHGSQGSKGMNLRKKELKTIRPAEKLVDAMGQIGFDKYEWEPSDE
ncbi:ORF6N domain-containing protein [Pantoea sp. BAV 3049]|uniref:ORF6N domain-containing protein n=1 Tax=Pantoea sp. BAV 3049 TaxID=2654188 RepID=UPI00131DCDF0|nr:ORF6N domain-containing protein [Pantoea sp. BAV 3049]